MISNRRVTIERPDHNLKWDILSAIDKELGRNAIRWYISSVEAAQINVEATFYEHRSALSEDTRQRPIIVALRHGIHLPSMTRPLKTLRHN